MTFPLPKYVIECEDPDERAKRYTRFVVRLAALYYSERGSVDLLSIAIARHPGSLAQVNKITGQVAIALESVLNDPNFTRDLLAPSLFTAPE